MLAVLGVMLKEVQNNLKLLLEELKKQILKAIRTMVEQSKQRRIKAEIQQIFDKKNWERSSSSNSSKDKEIIFTKQIVIEEPITLNTEVWLTLEDKTLFIQHTKLY